MVQSLQASVLSATGATGAVREELIRYDARRFERREDVGSSSIPLADEAFVPCWEDWSAAASRKGVFATLADHLPQLRFPVQAGISAHDSYRTATLSGASLDGMPAATGLHLERPEDLSLELYPSMAGRVPVLTTRHRPDFISLTQALAKRNEPVPIPAGQGAVMVSGYNNWTRIRQLREAWQARPPASRTEPSWPEAFARIRNKPSLFRDRLIILSDGPYSAVPAGDLGLDEATWRQRSLAIRREHECTHYLTYRFFGSAKNHLLDEVLADYAGLVAATGRFNAIWFQRFLGLEGGDSTNTAGSRLGLYRGTPALSDQAFEVLKEILYDVSENVERFDRCLPRSDRSLTTRINAIQALATFSLLELGASDVPDRLTSTVEELARTD